MNLHDDTTRTGNCPKRRYWSCQYLTTTLIRNWVTFYTSSVRAYLQKSAEYTAPKVNTVLGNQFRHHASGQSGLLMPIVSPGLNLGWHHLGIRYLDMHAWPAAEDTSLPYLLTSKVSPPPGLPEGFSRRSAWKISTSFTCLENWEFKSDFSNHCHSTPGVVRFLAVMKSTWGGGGSVMYILTSCADQMRVSPVILCTPVSPDRRTFYYKGYPVGHTREDSLMTTTVKWPAIGIDEAHELSGIGTDPVWQCWRTSLVSSQTRFLGVTKTPSDEWCNVWVVYCLEGQSYSGVGKGAVKKGFA